MEKFKINKPYSVFEIEPLSQVINKKTGKIIDKSICRIIVEDWEDANDFYKDNDDEYFDEPDEVCESSAAFLLDIDELEKVISYLQEIVKSNKSTLSKEGMEIINSVA